MNHNNIVVGVVVFLLLYYIYKIQYYQIKTPQLFADEVISSGMLKTGDLILFKAYNNFNSIFINSYFGHIGVVYVPSTVDSNGHVVKSTPMLFEANGIEHVPLKPHHNPNGIFLTPLEDRINKYKGRCFWKPLSEPLSPEVESDFKEFIDYCLENMYYDYRVLKSGIKKGMGLERCAHGTNCGEIVFLSLIKMGLLDYSMYDVSAFHHLKWMCDVQEMEGGYRYLDLVELITHPFAS